MSVAAAAALISVLIIVVLFSQIKTLKNSVNLLQNEVSSLRINVSNVQGSLTGQIRDTIYTVLSEEAELLSTFRWELTDFDLVQNTADIRFEATMKEYSAGSKLQFCAEWIAVDESSGRTASDWSDGPDFAGEITIPLNYLTEVSIRVEDVDGNIKEQAVEDIHSLHPDNFHLEAYNLTAPFAITVKGFGVTSTTAKAEDVYVEIVSMLPEFICPEDAVLTAHVNGNEVFSENVTIASPQNDKGVFRAHLRDIYYDLTLKEGDRFDVVLTVKDNLGRVEEFTDSATVNMGRLKRAPMATATAPAVPIG